MKPALALVMAAALYAEGTAVAGSSYTEVGSIPSVCPMAITVKNEFKLPSGWKVSPLEAVTIAAKEGLVRCNNPFLQSVYADSTSYYIVKEAFGSINANTGAVLVNGVTGVVTVREANGK